MLRLVGVLKIPTETRSTCIPRRPRGARRSRLLRRRIGCGTGVDSAAVRTVSSIPPTVRALVERNRERTEGPEASLQLDGLTLESLTLESLRQTYSRAPSSRSGGRTNRPICWRSLGPSSKRDPPRARDAVEQCGPAEVSAPTTRPRNKLALVSRSRKNSGAGAFEVTPRVKQRTEQATAVSLSRARTLLRVLRCSMLSGRVPDRASRESRASRWHFIPLGSAFFTQRTGGSGRLPRNRLVVRPQSQRRPQNTHPGGIVTEEATGSAHCWRLQQCGSPQASLGVECPVMSMRSCPRRYCCFKGKGSCGGGGRGLGVEVSVLTKELLPTTDTQTLLAGTLIFV